jgi:hypothetical protein
MRQLNDKPNPVYKVGFIREKGKATTRKAQWSLEASNSLLRLRLEYLWTFLTLGWGVFSLVLHFKCFLR